MTGSDSGAPSANVHQEETEPSFGSSFRIIDLGCPIASCRQIPAVRRKSNTPNVTKSRKHIVSPVIPVIDVTERMTQPTFRGVGYEPS